MTVDTESLGTMTDHVAALRQWIIDNEAELNRFRTRSAGGIDAAVEQDRALLRLLFDAGWSRWGWPSAAGGLGGGLELRAMLYDELAAARIEIPEAFVILETLGPVLTQFSPGLAKAHLGTFLRGDELWGQGFSEPGSGSDLASLTTRAQPVPDGYVLSGQKVWTTLGQFADHAGVLARTGSADSAHRGLSFFWVDCSSPGVRLAPITAANGRDEFAEMFFDDVFVPADNLVGELNQGWQVAMYLLQFERGTYAWLRQAVLHARLRAAANAAGTHLPPSTHRAMGIAFGELSALRARSAVTVRKLSRGESPGSDVSVDKILLSRAEKAVFEACRKAQMQRLMLSDEPADETLREEWFYSRVTSIFGGAVEVQRDIIADRVLDLPKGDRHG